MATIKAVINSALSISRYSDDKFEPIILDVFGEWNKSIYKEMYNLKFYSLNHIGKFLNFSS